MKSADPVLSIEQKQEQCRRAGHWLGDVECWQCGGEGVSHHDCGEDVCCCRWPEDNVRCDICDGKGGYKVCFTCHPGAMEDGA